MTCIRQRRKDGVRLDGLRQLSSEAPMGCASTTYAPTRPAPSFGRPEKTATVRAASASKVHHEEGPQAGESDAGLNAPATRKRKTRVAHSATKSWLSLELTKAAHAVSSSVIALYSSTPPPPKACSASHRAPIQPKRSRCHRCTWPSRTALVVALRGIPSDSASSTSIIEHK